MEDDQRQELRKRVFQAADKLVEQPGVTVHAAAVLNEVLGSIWGDQRTPAFNYYKEWCSERGYRGTVAYWKQALRNFLDAAIVISILGAIYAPYSQSGSASEFVSSAWGLGSLAGGIVGAIIFVRGIRPLTDKFLTEKPRYPVSPKSEARDEE